MTRLLSRDVVQDLPLWIQPISSYWTHTLHGSPAGAVGQTITRLFGGKFSGFHASLSGDGDP